MEARVFKLPNTIVSNVELNRLIRELDNISEILLQLKLRQAGENVKLPKTSILMDNLIELNSINLLQETDRVGLQKKLSEIKRKAPVVNISLPSDPEAKFLDRIISWFRINVDPYLLLNVGLQPNIGAGCIVRTTNKLFDFSLRQNFQDHQNLLRQELFKDVLKTDPAPESKATEVKT